MCQLILTKSKEEAKTGMNRQAPSFSSSLSFHSLRPNQRMLSKDNQMLSKGNHTEYQHEQSNGFAKTDNGNVLCKALSRFSHSICACRTGFS